MQDLIAQHEKNCINLIAAKDFIEHPLVKQMTHNIERSLKSNFINYPCHTGIQLAYLMHVNPKVLFVTCNSLFLAPPTYLKFVTTVTGDHSNLNAMPWITTGEHSSGTNTEIKEMLNAFYFFTLSYKDILQTMEPHQLGF